MKAVLVEKPQSVSLVDVPKPVIRETDDIIIKVLYGGICGSDIGIYTGSNALATYPRIIGHEFCGIVDAVGNKVSDIAAGDLVSVDIVNSCGKCYACRTNHHNVCEQLEVTGVHRNGGFAEYYKAKRNNVYKLDKTVISPEMACLVEPYAVGVEVNERAQITADDKVVVFGAGPAGIAIMHVARARGAEVLITDITETRLQLASAMSATRAINVAKTDLNMAVMEFTDNDGAHVIADAVCSTQSIIDALDLLAPSGRFVVLGTGSATSAIPQMAFTKKGINVFGTRVNNHRFPAVIDLFTIGKINPLKMHTHTFSFADIGKAFDLLSHDKNNVCKILLQW